MLPFKEPFDTSAIILSYSDIINQLVALATGTYPIADYDSAWFYSYFKLDRCSLEDRLVLLADKAWTNDDLKQEIIIVWHDIIVRYFTPSDNKVRKQSLRRHLFRAGAFRLIKLIKMGLENLDMLSEIANDDLDETPDLDSSFILPKNLLTKPFFGFAKHLSPEARYFCYKVFMEGVDIKELQDEYNTDSIYRELLKIANS